MPVRRSLALLALALLTCGAEGRAHAAEVRVESAPASLDRDGLVARVDAELAQSHRDGVVEIAFDATARTLRVRFTPRDGSPIERTIATPENEEERLRAVVWLVSNLVRDESADLVAQLAPPIATAPVVGPPPPPLVSVAVARPCDRPAPSSPVAVAFVSPLGWPSSPTDTAFALGVVYSDVWSVNGGAVAPLLRTRCDVNGGAVSVASMIGGRVDGVSLAGAFQRTGERARGAMLSGVFGLHSGPVEGTTIAPVTYASELHGAQLAVLNIGGSVNGAQVGLVNIAGDVKGAQVGLINVNRDADAAVGLTSVSWSRRVRLVAWTSTITPIQVGILLEGKRVFSTVNLGRLLDIATKGDLILGFELGGHLVRSDDVGFIADVVLGVDSSVGTGSSAPLDVTRLGARIGYRAIERFAPYLYGGGALVSTTPPPGQTPSIEDVRLRAEIGGGAIF